MGTESSTFQERHRNAAFFLRQGQQRNFEQLLEIASPAHAEQQRVSPEHHFARLLKTSDCALLDNRHWTLEVVFEQWYARYEKELSALMPAKDKATRLIEFLAAHNDMKCGYGETPLTRAIAEAHKATPPPKVATMKKPQLSLLACVCRALARQDEHEEACFFLSCRDAGEIVGMSWQTGHAYLSALCAIKVLEVVKPGTKGPNGKATRYKWLLPLEDEK